jgi:ATP-dependent RNA helicase DeaD
MTEKKQADAFAALGLDKRLTAVLAELGYEEPTPVQAQAIPVLLEGRDLLGQAATGTGKTAAFALPLLQRLFVESEDRSAVAVLVLVPTRELAMQVAEALHRYGRPVQLRVLPIYGGQAISLQLRALRRGVDVVVATPGRARDHLRRGTLVLGGIRAVVLDEADEMLDMGFAEDLEAILETVPSERQTALFSATLPSRIAAIAKRHLRDAVRLTVQEEHTKAGALPRVRQVAYIVTRSQKVDGLSRILDLESPTSALVFCRTRNEVEELAQSLAGRGQRAEALHGGFTQAQRDRVMRRFRDGAADLLLATDVAARGLDIKHLTHVVNFDVPSAPESYVHRIGRTGRAGADGVAITLVEPRERSLLKNIERLTGRRIEVQELPTVADLRARRLELTRASLREALVRGGTEGARVVVEALASEFELFEIATAAVHLIQEASERDGARAAADDTALEPPSAAPVAGAHTARHAAAKLAGPTRPAGAAKPAGATRPARAAGAAKPSGAGQEFTRVYVSAGREAGVRPGDLVGAITGEAGVPGEAVGAIELADRFALVEVREGEADAVVEALRKATIRGRRVTASRYRDPAVRQKSTPAAKGKPGVRG